jgi:hypothetical protein
MALPFRRLPRSAEGAKAAPASASPVSAQRQWMVRALLCTLSAPVRQALAAWLLAPTDPNRWPPSDTFSPRRWRLHREEYWDQPPAVACHLLYEELRAIRQTLDLPAEALSRLHRNGLLTVHAIRLRQLEWRLWPRLTARKIREIIA